MRHACLIGLLMLAAAPLAAAPYIRIVPSAAHLDVGEVLDITIEISTDGGLARGGAVDMNFDPTLFEVVGGEAGITQDAASGYILSPPPKIVEDRIAIAFRQTDFSLVSYTGPLARFQLRPITFRGVGAVEYKPADTSRFSPRLPNTELGTATYAVTAPASALRDYLLGIGSAPTDQNTDGVIDIADLLQVF